MDTVVHDIKSVVKYLILIQTFWKCCTWYCTR